MKRMLFVLIALILLVSCTKIIPKEEGIEWLQGEMENKDYYLLHFFNVHCTLCIEQSKELNEISEKIPEIQVIGVNIPEFEFQKKADILKPELERNEIKYTVISDRNQTIRIAYNQTRVPGFVLLDKKGQIIDKTTDLKQIKARLLKLYPNKELTLESPMHILSKKTTPRLYGGYNYARTPFGNIDEKQFEKWQNFSLPKILMEDKIYVYGEWFPNQDRLNFISAHPGMMVIRAYGSKVNMLARSKNYQNVTVFVDNLPIQKENAGTDIFYNQNGESYFVAGPNARVFNIAKYDKEERRTFVFYPSANRFNFFWIEFS